MDYVKLWTTFHDDPSIQNLSPKAIVYYVNALSWSGRHETNGVFQAIGKVPGYVQELVDAGKLIPTGSVGSFTIHGWPSRQVSTEDLEQLRSKRRAAGRVGGQRSGEARAKQSRSNLLPDVKQTDEAEVEVEVEPSGTSYPHASELCELLADLDEANGSKRPAVTQRWLDESERMLRIDQRDHVEAEALLRWALADPFWRSNIRSMVKFRAQYDTLRLQRDRGTNGVRGDGPSLPSAAEVLAAS